MVKSVASLVLRACLQLPNFHQYLLLRDTSSCVSLLRTWTFFWVALPCFTEGMWIFRAISMPHCTKTYVPFHCSLCYFADLFAKLYKGKDISSLVCTSHKKLESVLPGNVQIKGSNCFITTNDFHIPSAFQNTNYMSPEHPDTAPLLTLTAALSPWKLWEKACHASKGLHWIYGQSHLPKEKKMNCILISCSQNFSCSLPKWF